MPEDLTERVFVVTGASSGIGEATARSLADAGARLVLGARRGDRIDGLARSFEGRAVAVRTDVRSPDDCRRLVDTALDTFGALDGLVANAGLGVYGGILDQTDDQVRQMVDVNVNGTIWAIRAAVPHLVQRGGDIVIVSSVAGLRGQENEAVYAATKHAQMGLAGGLDRELHRKGVRVTALCPGGVRTEFAMGTGRSSESPELAGMLSAEDVAEAITFVLSQPRHVRSLVYTMRSATEAD